MTIRKAIGWQFLIFLAAAAYSAVMAVSLPDRVPIHWGLNGQPDGWGSKWTNLLLMPGMLLGLLLLTLVLPMISPKGFNPTASGNTYGYVMVLVSGLSLAMHVVIVQASTHAGLDVGKTITGVIFLFFALFGNVMGRIKRNFWIGIRTPWTLADERVWTATHRSAGRLWLVGGLLGAVACFAGVPMAIGFAYLLVLSFVPVMQSYFLYRKGER